MEESSQPPPVNSIEVQNNSDPKAAPTVTTAGSSLPPTIPYRSAGGLAPTESLMNSNNNVGGGGGGGASVSTISPGSLNQNNPASGSAGNANNAVQFSARDASVLQTPNLNNTTNTNISNDGVTSPRSAANRRATLQNSQSNLQNSLASFYATQNTHLEGAFGALMASIQDHTEELDVHQTNLDRLDQEINGPGDASLRPSVSHLQTDLSHLQTNVKSIREEVDVVYDQFQNLTGVVGTIERNVTDVTTNVAHVQGRVEQVDGRVTTVESTSTTNHDTLRSQLDAARTQLALLSSDVTAPTGKVATLTTRLDAVATELSTTQTNLAHQVATLTSTTTALLQKLETDTLRKFDDVDTAHARTLEQMASMTALVDRAMQDHAALTQVVDSNRLAEASNRSALEQSVRGLVAAVQTEMEQDRASGATVAANVSQTAETLERLDQDVQGLRLLDRERNRQLVELAALPQLLSSLQAEVDVLRNGNVQARGTDGGDQGVEAAALAALRDELTTTRAELAEMKHSAGGGTPTAAASRGIIDLNAAEISRVQEKTRQLRTSPPSSPNVEEAFDIPTIRDDVVESADSEPGEIVISQQKPQQAADVVEEDDPNDQINAALDGLRKLQESLNRDRAHGLPPADAADRLNARSTARSGDSVPSSAHSSPVVAVRKDLPPSVASPPQEKAPKIIDSVPTDEASSPEDTLRQAREEVALLRQAREEINASLAALKMGSGGDVTSPPASPPRNFGAPGHTPAPVGRRTSAVDSIADAARRRLRDGDSPMVAAATSSSAPDPTAPNVSRGGAFPASSIGTGTYCEKSVTTVTTETSGRESSAPTPARNTGTQLDYDSTGDHGRGVDPPDEASAKSGAKSQRYSDPPVDDLSSTAAQVAHQKVPPVIQQVDVKVAPIAVAASDVVATTEVTTTENKGVVFIQKTTDERKKYQYYNPGDDEQKVVEQQSSSVVAKVAETTGTAIEVVAAQLPQSPLRESTDRSPESSPDTSKWSTKSASNLIEQRRIQRMLAGRASMEAGSSSNPPPPPPPPQPTTDDNLSPQTNKSPSSMNPSPRDRDNQRSIRHEQMSKARPQGQIPSSAAAPPSRHRSIVEEAIQFARSSRGSPAAPSKDMATSPKDFLSKQSKSTEGQRRRQQRMEKDFGPSPTNAQTTQMSSPRMDSEQSMVVTPDEKSPNSAKDLSNVRLEPSPIGGSPDDFENLRRATGSGPSAISPINSQQSIQIVQAPAATVQSSEATPGCYLVYLSDSGGKLVLHYSKTPVDSAIGFWRAGQGKSIQGFKYRQNSGRVELIKGIAGGDANKRKFFSGWCQFIKAAAAFNGSARKFPNVGGLEIELYAHNKDGTCHFLDVDNEEVDVSKFDAIACLPKNNNLFQGVHSIDVNRFVNTANIAGAALPL